MSWTRWWIMVVALGWGGMTRAAEETVPESDPDAGESAASAWDASDTALANHYIQSLVQNPESGRVLELLWKHYADHGQTRLLLQHFEEAARPRDAVAAKLILGHLLLRKGNADQAIARYEEVLTLAPDHPVVLGSLVQAHRAAGNPEAALPHAERRQQLAGPGSDAWVAAGFLRADLLLELGREDDAVAAWKDLLAGRPGDAGLRQEIAGLFLGRGFTAEALECHRDLARSTDTEVRLDALREMGRLHEAREELAEAVAVYESALASLHFRHFKYDGFLTSLVRTREQGGGLPELAARWKAEASGSNSPEDALWRMVRLARLTADAPLEEEWLRQLVARVPGNPDYLQMLAERSFRNGNLAEAERIVEDLVAKVRPAPAELVFLRADIRLRAQGPDGAAAVLRDYLGAGAVPPEMLKRVLRFAETHYLDEITEQLLRDQKERGWGEEGQAVEVKMAAFHRERGRPAVARDTLLRYVAEAEDTPAHGQRAAEAARALIDLRMPGEAREILERFVAAGEADRSLYLLLAELRSAEPEAAPAVAALEKAWELGRTLSERKEADDRIFSLLRARAGEGDSAEPREEGEVWAELWAFYDRVKRNATDEAPEPVRFRAAWWAVRIADYDEAYRILPLLHDPDQPALHQEELLLELAERTGNQALVIRQLELIARIQPDREEEALIRKAETRLALGFEDESVRLLRSIADRPGATLKAVQALARAYRQQGRHRALEELWGKAFATANLLERREILDPYAETLVHLGKIPEALALYMDMIDGESDLSQRRRLFDDQLALASRHYRLETWMLEHYESSVHAHPLDGFYLEGVARIHRSIGNHPEAFAAMRKAYYLGGGDASLLPHLGDLARRTNDLDAAIYFQRQLISGRGPGASPEEWLALIARMEETLDVAGADQVRRELEDRFAHDADFLRELARTHREQGDPEAALRVWQRVVALRPWDASARFETGLLQRELLRTEDAVSSFESVLEGTEGAAAGEPVDPLAPAAGPSPGLQGLAGVVERFPFLTGPSKTEAVAWLSRPRTEFQSIPPDPRGLRLRSIEELARLRGQTDGWRQRWAADPALTREERLWAAVHAGGSDWSASVVEELARPAEGAGFLPCFRYSVLSLRTGNDHRLLSWAGTDPERRQHVLLAIDIVLRDSGPSLSPERLTLLIRGSGVSPNDARRLMQSLHQDGFPGEALRLGEALAETGAGPDFLFYLDVADLAAELGDELVRERWTRRAFDELDFDFRPIGKIPFSSLHRIISDVQAILAPGPARGEVIKDVHAKLAGATSLSEEELAEARMWIHLATGQPERALQELEQLAALVRGGAPSYRMADGTPAPGTTEDPWGRLGDLFTQVGDRLPSREPLDRWADPIVGPYLRGAAWEDSGDAAASSTRVRMLLWTLETANRPTRERTVAEFLAMACEEETFLELARGLESRNMAAEAVLVYAALLQRDGSSQDALQGFLTVCRQAKACDEALAVLEAYRDGLLPRPEWMTPDFLHRHRATFLRLARRTGELARIAQEGKPDGTEETDAAPEVRTHYLHCLAAVYEEAGDTEAAVRILETLRAGSDGLSKPDQFRLIDGYLALGKTPEAEAMLRAFKLRGGDPNTDQVIRRLGAIQAREPGRGGFTLRALAMQAVRLPASVEVCGELATHLSAAGDPALADSLLTLRARRGATPLERFEATRRRVALRQTSSEPALQVRAPLLVSWLLGLPDLDLPAGNAILALARSAAPPERAAWAEAASILAASPETRLLGDLLRLTGGIDPAEIAGAIDRYVETEDEHGVRFAAQVVASHGLPSFARKWLAASHSRRDTHPLEDTPLVLSVYHALEDGPAIQEWRDRVSRYSGANSSFMRFAAGFFSIGRPDLALGLMDERYRSLRVLTSDQNTFLSEYVRHLIREGVLDQAQRVLMAMFQKSLGADSSLLIDFYRAAGKLERFERELDKYYLPDGERRELLSRYRTSATAPGRPGGFAAE